MKKTTICSFYEMNIDEMYEQEAFVSSLSADERDGYEKMVAHIASENTTCANCGDYCKYLEVEEGLMYETMYLCKAPGNEHIVSIECDDTEDLTVVRA